MWPRVFLLLLAPLFIAPKLSAEQPQDRRAPFKERWQLELLPDNVPPIGELLPGTAWVQRHPRTILGVGVDYAVRFPVPQDDRREPELHFTAIGYPSVNNREAGVVETTHKYPLRVDGAFLQYDGLVHTAFVVKDERLILDAVVQVKDGKWYQLGARRLGREGARRKDLEVKELLFDFHDDPLRHDEGKLTVQRRLGKLPDGKGETVSIPATYRLESKTTDDKKMRRVKLVADVVNRVRHNLPDLYLFPGQGYALTDESFPDYPTGVFEIERGK